MDYVITWREASFAFVAMITFLACSLLSGVVITKRFIPGTISPFRLFVALVVGMTMIVSIYAIYKTRGTTILLLVPMLLVAGVFLLKNDDNLPPDPDLTFMTWRNCIVILISFSVLYFSAFLQVYLGGEKGFFSYPGVDNLFYARVIDYLNIYGIENNQGDFFFPQDVGITPYHYFDLWIGAFISNIFGIRSINALFLCTYPIFCILSTIGILVLLHSIFREAIKIWVLLLVSGLSAFFSGSKLFFPSFIIKADVFDFSIFNYPKVALISIFLAFLILLAQKSFWNSFLVFGSIFSSLFINALPAILMSCILCVIVYVIVLKDQSFKKILPGVFLSVLGFAYVPLLYYFFAIKSAEIDKGSFDSLFSQIDRGSLRTTFNILIGGNFQFLTLMPFIILGISIASKKIGFNREGLGNLVSHYRHWILLLIFSLSGLVSWAIMHMYSTESVQFFHNILIPSSGIFIALIIGLCLTSYGFIRYAALLAILLMVYSNRNKLYHRAEYGKKDWVELRNFVRTSGGWMANLRGQKDFQTFFSKNTSVYQPQEVLYFLLPSYNNTCLNVFEIPGDDNSVQSAQINKFISQTPLFKISTMVPKGDSPVAEKSQKALIKKFGIKYISVSTNATIPNFIEMNVSESITLGTTGWRIVKLKQ